MKTANSGRTLMTPGLTSAPFSEAMPLHPQNGDEVIAVNVGSSTYTLTGTITGGDVVLDAGETSILVYVGSAAGWVVTWRSETGAVVYPISVAHGGTGADLSGLATGQMVAFGGAVFAGVGLSIDSNSGVTGGSPGVTGFLQFYANGAGPIFDSAVRLDADGGRIWAGITYPGLGTLATDVDVASSLRVGVAQNFIDFYMAADSPLAVDSIGISVGGNANLYQLTGGAFFPNSELALCDLGTVDDVWTNGFFGGTVTAGQFVGSSAAGISALFQTSATDGSNALPTAVFAGNTGQTAPLTEWRASDGASVNSRVLVDTGIFVNYASFVDDANFSGLQFFNGGGGTGGVTVFEDGTEVGGITALDFGWAGGTRVTIDSTGGFESVGLYAGTGGAIYFAADSALEPIGADSIGNASTKWVDGWFSGTVTAGGYSVGATPGITGTVTTASLIGKTMSFTNGIYMGLA